MRLVKMWNKERRKEEELNGQKGRDRLEEVVRRMRLLKEDVRNDIFGSQTFHYVIRYGEISKDAATKFGTHNHLVDKVREIRINCSGIASYLSSFSEPSWH